jgi:hypothetical protein
MCRGGWALGNAAPPAMGGGGRRFRLCIEVVVAESNDGGLRFVMGQSTLNCGGGG